MTLWKVTAGGVRLTDDLSLTIRPLSSREFIAPADDFAGPRGHHMERISRTIGTDQMVDELVMSFTHDIAISHLLPGVPPTGKRVRVAVCVVAGFQNGKLSHEHIYWDQASVLVQVGLLDPAGLPVVGAEQAEKLLAPRAVPANTLLGPDWHARA